MRRYERLGNPGQADPVAVGQVTLLAASLVILLAWPAPAAVFTVTNTNDAGPGSLRGAVIQANGSIGHDTIDFAIAGAGPHTILPLNPLPMLTDTAGVLIDGLSQSGASAGANPPTTAVLMIEVNGANAGANHGFHIVSPNNIIQGMVVDSFEQDGIRIESTELGTYGNHIYCNFVGTDPWGMVACGNGYNRLGYWAGVNVIVPPAPVPTFVYDNLVEANLISSNYAEGVGISSCPPGDAYQNVVADNYIGTDITGMVDLGNVHDGVYIGEGAHHNFVDNNLISGNDFQGVCIVGYAELGIHTDSNYVFENTIGLTASLTPLPNTIDGVTIGVYGDTTYYGGHARGNEVGPNNTIAHNGRHGVMIWEHPSGATNADGNRITMNAIYDNTGLGIDLSNDGVTMNDPSDPDMGPNEELNYPDITIATTVLGLTTISGTLDIDSDPTQSVIEVFRARMDGSGYGEGYQYLGFATPDGAGNWTMTTTGLTAGDSVTATCSDLNGNSSEFSGVLDVGIAEEEAVSRRVGGRLLRVSPNPLVGQTAITCIVPTAGHVRLSVCDIRGSLVETLVDEEKNSGVYRFTWSARDLSGGVYFCRLDIDMLSGVSKMVVLR